MRARCQYVDQSLAEAREKNLIGNHAWSTRLTGAIAALIKKDHVQIRAVAELKATELAVADDREPRGRFSLRALADGLAVTLHQAHRRHTQ